MEIDGAGPRQRRKGLDRRQKLHAVVRRLGLTTLQLLFRPAKAQDRAPAARSRIAGTGAIGEDLDPFLAHAGAPSIMTPYSAGPLTWAWKRSLRRYSFGSFLVTKLSSGTVSQS